MDRDTLRELLKISVIEILSNIDEMDKEELYTLKYRLRGVVEGIEDYLGEV